MYISLLCSCTSGLFAKLLVLYGFVVNENDIQAVKIQSHRFRSEDLPKIGRGVQEKLAFLFLHLKNKKSTASSDTYYVFTFYIGLLNLFFSASR